jgi:hypothetical protein
MTTLANDWFAAPQCRNCNAALATPFCGTCGQKRATRLGRRAIGSEAWSNFRVFELTTVKAVARVLREPGTVAREYVLGRRTALVHPLKLLAIAIGLLLVVLSRSAYLDSANTHVSQAMELVRAWSNWSFSLGIAAIFIASFGLFRRRLGYNATEHLVLAAYAQTLVIFASVAMKLPTLVFPEPAFVAAHKSASVILMDVVGAAVVVVSFRQFFLLDARRDAWRLVAAALAYLVVKAALVRFYAIALVKVVLAHLA